MYNAREELERRRERSEGRRRRRRAQKLDRNDASVVYTHPMHAGATLGPPRPILAKLQKKIRQICVLGSERDQLNADSDLQPMECVKE